MWFLGLFPGSSSSLGNLSFFLILSHWILPAGSVTSRRGLFFICVTRLSLAFDDENSPSLVVFSSFSSVVFVILVFLDEFYDLFHTQKSFFQFLEGFCEQPRLFCLWLILLDQEGWNLFRISLRSFVYLGINC